LTLDVGVIPVNTLDPQLNERLRIENVCA